MPVLLRHKHWSTTSFGYWRLLLPQKKSHRGFHSRAPLVWYVRYKAHSGDPKSPMPVLLRHKHLSTTSFGFWRLLLLQKKSHRGFDKNPDSDRSRFVFKILAPKGPTRPRAEFFWVSLSSLQRVNAEPTNRPSWCPPREASCKALSAEHSSAGPARTLRASRVCKENHGPWRNSHALSQLLLLCRQHSCDREENSGTTSDTSQQIQGWRDE